MKFNKERKDIFREHKSEVKFWRKELGDERTMKIQLELKIKAFENVKEITPVVARPFPPRKTKRVNKSARSLSENVQCSICSATIDGYIPIYFLGEKFNPACESCKANDSSWNSDDPFSSFAVSSQPVSMVSHWLPLESYKHQNPSSISSLVTHCVKLPNPGDQFITIEEAMEVMKESFQTWFK